jgi:DNA repair protein RadC
VDQLDDNDLLNLFSAVGRVVSKRFLMKRPALNSGQLVIDYLTSAMGFELREQLYLDKRNNLVADEVLAEGIRWRRGGHALWSPLFLMSVWDLCEVAA